MNNMIQIKSIQTKQFSLHLYQKNDKFLVELFSAKNEKKSESYNDLNLANAVFNHWLETEVKSLN